MFSRNKIISLISGVAIGAIVSISMVLFFSFYFEGKLDKIPKKLREIVYGREKSQTLYANDFDAVYTITNLPKFNKTAGIFASDDKNIIVYEQDSLTELWKKYQLEKRIKDAEPFLDKGGGLKQIFKFNGDLFGLVTLVKSDNCYFASLINFSKSKEVFRAPCLPDADLLDLNGVGGGFAELNGSLLLALGAPEHSSTKIANLAQDKVSPYGKILIFTAQDLYYKPDSNMKYSTYALGVRNPEGMVNLDGDVYSVEHGPKGGDELNFIEKDGNYGWPKYSLGSKYSGEPYTITGDVKFYKMPIYSFTPSAAISDVIACPASLKKRYFPLQCLLIASLRGRSIFIALIEKTTRKLIQIERLEIGMRVREFSRDSSEKLYFTTDGLGVFQLEFNNIGDQPKN